MNVDALERPFGAWIKAHLQARADEAIALDGKTLRGARTHEQSAPHLLAFCTHESQETLLFTDPGAQPDSLDMFSAFLVQ